MIRCPVTPVGGRPQALNLHPHDIVRAAWAMAVTRAAVDPGLPESDIELRARLLLKADEKAMLTMFDGKLLLPTEGAYKHMLGQWYDHHATVQQKNELRHRRHSLKSGHQPLKMAEILTTYGFSEALDGLWLMPK